MDEIRNGEKRMERKKCENEVGKGNEPRCGLCNDKLGVCGYLEKVKNEDQSKKLICMECGKKSGFEREID